MGADRLTGFGFVEQVEEDLGCAGEGTAAAVDDAEGAEEGFFEGDGAEAAFGDFLAEDGGGEEADGIAEAEGFLHALDVVKAHDDAGADALLAEEAFDVAADGEVFIEADEGGVGELGGVEGGGGGEGVRRGAGDDHGFFAPGEGEDFAGGFGIADEAEVDAVVDDGLIDLFGAKVVDLEVGAGKAAGEFGFEAGHFGDADGVDGGNADGSTCGAAEVFEADEEFLVAAEDIAAEVVEEFAGGEDFEGAAGAVEELSAKEAFKFLDGLAGGGLGDAVEGGAAADAAGLNDVFEEVQLGQVHERIIA